MDSRRPETLVIDERLDLLDIDAELAGILDAGRATPRELQHPPVVWQRSSLAELSGPNLPVQAPYVVKADGSVAPLIEHEQASAPSLTTVDGDLVSLEIIEPSPWPARIVHGIRYSVVAALAAGTVPAAYQVISAVTGFVASHGTEIVTSVVIGVLAIAWLYWRIQQPRQRGSLADRGLDPTQSLVSINRRWVSELRYGNWRQSRATYGDGRNRHCALGLLYRIANDGTYSSGVFKRQHLINLGYNPDFLNHVEHMNQNGKSFTKIANFVERETARGYDWAGR